MKKEEKRKIYLVIVCISFFTGTAVLGITVTGADCSTVSGNRYQPDTDAGYSTCHSIRVCCPGMRMALYKSFKKESAASGSTDIRSHRDHAMDQRQF